MYPRTEPTEPGAGQDSDWDYPPPALRTFRDHLAFYASRVDAFWIGDEPDQAQQGDIYGVWITGNVVGPVKCAPGSGGR